MRYRATFSGRKHGAIGAWSPAAVTFRIEAREPIAPTRAELKKAAIKAAHQFGFEVNHIDEVLQIAEEVTVTGRVNADRRPEGVRSGRWPLRALIERALDRGPEYDPTCVLCESGEEPGHEH